MRWLNAYAKGIRRARGAMWAFYIRGCGGRVGRRLEVDSRARLRWPPHAGLKLGEDVYVGIGVVIDLHREGRLHIQDRVKLMQYSVVACSGEISIGTDSQVAEFSSVRDADHGMDLDRPMREQTVVGNVYIGHDVWVGRGVAVLRGAMIGDGAVVGANSVVKGVVPPYAVAVGMPATVKRTRS